MRKITEKSISAFNNRMCFNQQNTQVICWYGKHKLTGDIKGNGKTLLLHGNDIAININGRLFITNAGYKTNTTKERLNGLDGVNIVQRKGTWCLNGNEWDGSIIEIV